jgi:mannitol/fructose-specific phosphotransferase system IIA component
MGNIGKLWQTTTGNIGNLWEILANYGKQLRETSVIYGKYWQTMAKRQRKKASILGNFSHRSKNPF